MHCSTLEHKPHTALHWWSKSIWKACSLLHDIKQACEFPILLVVLVIIISSYSDRFSNLIGEKDLAATLATQILSSYATLLEICFKKMVHQYTWYVSLLIILFAVNSHGTLLTQSWTVASLHFSHYDFFFALPLSIFYHVYTYTTVCSKFNLSLSSQAY